MKKSAIGLTLGLFALLVMLSSTAWAANANRDYQVDENMLGAPYTSPDVGAAEEQPWDFAGAWRLAAAGNGAVTLQQDVLVTAADAPEGIFVQVPEDGQILLDLNGHSLTGGDVPCLIYVGARGRLTVTDSAQSGGRIVGVVGVDEGADDPNEWGQLELLGGVEVIDPNVAALDDPQAQAEYASGIGDAQTGTFEAMWNLAASKKNGTVKLLTNVTAVDGSFGTGAGFSSTGGFIIVPQNAAITLDLNGKTLDRHLSTPQANGHVIDLSVDSCNLVIMDSSQDQEGTITGGNSTGSGGGIYIGGSGGSKTLVVNSGKITGNQAEGYGGGIYVGTRGVLRFFGGSICGNTAEMGGGIYFFGGGC